MPDNPIHVIAYRSSVSWEVLRLNSDGSCYTHLADCRTQSDAEYLLRSLDAVKPMATRELSMSLLVSCSPSNKHTVLCKCDGRGIVPVTPGFAGNGTKPCDCPKCEGQEPHGH